MDFYRIKERVGPRGVTEIYPDFRVTRSKDLMVRGRSFYAIWDEDACLWSTDEYDVQRLVDEKLTAYSDDYTSKNEGVVSLKLLGDFGSNSWLQFRNYIGHLSDSSTQLDENLTFSNTEVRKEDYVSRRLPYPLERGSIEAYDEIMDTLYDPSDRAKVEWGIGSIVAGDAKNIQKFLVFYGAAGTGKSTVLNIIQKLFEGYYTTFEAKALTQSSNAFSTEVFKSNPLVALQHDGDLSKIEDNTKLNSIISHEEMTLNEKYKPAYMARINAFLFMGTNKPVKITDAKSGIIRRLIDVRPSGNLLSPKRYQTLISKLDFEMGAIAHHCLDTYREMGKDFYASYRPVEMMLQTDVYFNFIEAHYDIFKSQGGTTLKQAYELYKQFCEETLVEYKMPQYRFREELKNYFTDFDDRHELEDGTRVRSWYSGFHADNFKMQLVADEQVFLLVMEETESLLDAMLGDSTAQYATDSSSEDPAYWEIPRRSWDKVTTQLSSLDTTQLHYVKPPENHIVIDFDIRGEDGEKSLEKNLEAASQWPSTYAELSKGGNGVHLHYIYDGDVHELSNLYEEGVEIKVFTGGSSLRRRVSKANNVPVATINSGLPIKEKKVIHADTIKSEKGLRDLIQRTMKKEFHPGTKPSVDFIHKILGDAYSSGMAYDVSDLRGRIMAFANNSTNQALTCLKLVQTMQFQSEESSDSKDEPDEKRLVFFDCEVYPNLLMINWKYQGSDTIVRMINPSPQAVEELMTMKLVGFNCRRYDNHILYARYMGYGNEQIYKLSKKIIDNVPNAKFGEAYNISYADIYDFSSKKQSLKKFQLELGINHMEMELPWDEPVPEELWDRVADYCDNDVVSTEATFEARHGDFIARQILSDLSGLPVNETTQRHSSQIIFGGVRRPQESFVYTDLSEQFPGYKFDRGVSTYRDEITGEGGLVYVEEGLYENVALLDVESMHPTSIEQLDLFGEYTKNFSELKAARMALKHGDYDSARKMLGGKLAQYLVNVTPEMVDALSYALKIVINSVYGLTSASFDNSFRDPRNIDNIVAKRGALFMIDLKHFVQSKGFTVAHIKTDSIKIPNATKEIIDLVMEFGNDYGYTFDHEATFEKVCIINKADYVGKTIAGRKPAHWTATGTMFQHPYVFKTVFSKEPIEFDDLCETKSVTTALYLDMEAGKRMDQADPTAAPIFIGRAGNFVPIKEGCGGGLLLREKDGAYHAANGTKGYFWLEASMVKALGREEDVDLDYFESLVNDARNSIEKYGDWQTFAEL